MEWTSNQEATFPTLLQPTIVVIERNRVDGRCRLEVELGGTAEHLRLDPFLVSYWQVRRRRFDLLTTAVVFSLNLCRWFLFDTNVEGIDWQLGASVLLRGV